MRFAFSRTQCHASTAVVEKLVELMGPDALPGDQVTVLKVLEILLVDDFGGAVSRAVLSPLNEKLDIGNAVDVQLAAVRALMRVKPRHDSTLSLVKLLRSDSSPAALRVAAIQCMLVSAVSYGLSSPVARLVDRLASRDGAAAAGQQQQQRTSIVALFILAGSQPDKAMLVAAGAVQPLVDLLGTSGDNSPEVHEWAVAALLLLAFHDAHTSVIEAAGAREPLGRLRDAEGGSSDAYTKAMAGHVVELLDYATTDTVAANDTVASTDAFITDQLASGTTVAQLAMMHRMINQLVVDPFSRVQTTVAQSLSNHIREQLNELW